MPESERKILSVSCWQGRGVTAEQGFVLTPVLDESARLISTSGQTAELKHSIVFFYKVDTIN